MKIAENWSGGKQSQKKTEKLIGAVPHLTDASIRFRHGSKTRLLQEKWKCRTVGCHGVPIRAPPCLPPPRRAVRKLLNLPFPLSGSFRGKARLSWLCNVEKELKCILWRFCYLRFFYPQVIYSRQVIVTEAKFIRGASLRIMQQTPIAMAQQTSTL